VGHPAIGGWPTLCGYIKEVGHPAGEVGHPVFADVMGLGRQIFWIVLHQVFRLEWEVPTCQEFFNWPISGAVFNNLEYRHDPTDMRFS
jgi:hypothetical protein